MQPRASFPSVDLPLKIVGSNVYGRNPKINAEQTFNCIISDGWLVDNLGYKKAISIPGGTRGRAIYSSDNGQFMLSITDNIVYKITGEKPLLLKERLFELETYSGDVFIDENNGNQIAICDQKDLWIYNFRTGDIGKATLPNNVRYNLPIHPGYVTFHDGYFIVPDTTTNEWYLSALNNGLSWNWGAGSQPVGGSIQTKPGTAVCILRAPGRGNLIYAFTRDVMEMWYNNGGQGFPYQRTNSVSVDYGCLSPTTIAAMDNYVAWLGINEKSGPVIMVSTGSGFTRLSTDGIDFKLADVVNPQDSYAFFYKSDGHVFYQLTFFSPEDNFSLLYDFNTQSFSSPTDENMNFHIAEAVAFYNNTYYFVSIDGGEIYELNSNYTSYDYTEPSNVIPNPNPSEIFEIPRVRICNTMRQEDASSFIANSLVFTIRQGTDQFYVMETPFLITDLEGNVITQTTLPGFVGEMLTTNDTIPAYIPAVDISLSRDGGETFGSSVRQNLNTQGNRQNRVTFWKLGRTNELVVQLRFWSLSGLTVSDGVLQAKTQGAPR